MNRAKPGEKNGREVRKGRVRSYPPPDIKIKTKKRRTSSSIASDNSTLQCEEEQQKIEEQMNHEIQVNISDNKRRAEYMFVVKLNNASKH